MKLIQFILSILLIGFISTTYADYSVNDDVIQTNPCYKYYAESNIKSGFLNTVIQNSDATDKAACNLSAETAYSCMSVAMKHCDTWLTNKDVARACGRELLRGDCLNSGAVNNYKSFDITLE